MGTALIQDLFSYGFPRKLHAGPYGSYDNIPYYTTKTSKNLGKMRNIAFLAKFSTMNECGRCSGLMVSVLNSEVSGLGMSPDWGHCVVFLGKMLCSQCLSLLRCINGSPAMD